MPLRPKPATRAQQTGAEAPGRQRTRRRIHRKLALGSVAALVLLLGCIGWLRSLRYPLARLDPATATSTRWLDRRGEVIYERRSAQGGYSQWVTLEQVSPDLIAATLAGEDHRFYDHAGIDPLGVARALWLDVRAGGFAYGGSTITQQLAKLLRGAPRTLRSKLLEARDALALERTLDKDAILTQYLNRAYYGRLAYGVEAASRRFFGKPARELELHEASLLAILPRAPSAYDPQKHPERARGRRAHVLQKMVERGSITQRQADAAAAAPIVLSEQSNHPADRHIVDWLLLHSPETGIQTTTFDLELQRKLALQLDQHLSDIRRLAATQAGVVVLDNDSGGVLAMVGSRDYDDTAARGANNAALAHRSAGSTLKPFAYALALEAGRSMNDLVLDAPSEWVSYQPRNINGHHLGPVTLADALGSSLNLPAVRLVAELGPDRFAARLQRLGFSSVDPTAERHGLALALGGCEVTLLELAAAYASLTRSGLYHPPRWLDAQPTSEERVFEESAAREVARVLEDPSARQLEFGLESPLDLPFTAGAKTGTSSGFSDNWAVGFTRDVTVAVWVGNFDGQPLRGSLAMTGAAPLLADALTLATGDTSRSLPRRRRSGEKPPPEPFVVTSPRDGARFVIDPLLPRTMQRIALLTRGAPRSESRAARRAEPCHGQVRFVVDGKAAPTSSLALEPGRHHLFAEHEDCSGHLIRTPNVSFSVEETTDAS